MPLAPTPGPCRRRLARLRHLAGRWWATTRRRRPQPDDVAWARSLLSPAEAALWCRLSPADQAHAVDVARATETAFE
ncbi:MAG TPA: hypothetical protein DEP66_05235, partial [Acidimicrobiaceae bacterium]|nr:hypothetical protein [Acidimicrobiaceae bacterium]